jgi:RNA polymerase sigma factor (sigma-70 family)
MVQNSIGATNFDEALVGRILSGDNAAFGELIKKNQKLVFSITFRMLNNLSDNDDICQDIFIKAYTNLSKFKFDSKLSTWIARIAYTTCINHIKKRKVDFLDDIISVDDEDNNEDDFSTKIKDDLAEMPDETLFVKELRLKLSEEINSLPPLLKTIVILYHQEDTSYTEISEITGLPVGTVKSYLFRGRKLLREKFTAKFKQEDLL